MLTDSRSCCSHEHSSSEHSEESDDDEEMDDEEIPVSHHHHHHHHHRHAHHKGHHHHGLGHHQARRVAHNVHKALRVKKSDSEESEASFMDSAGAVYDKVVSSDSMNSMSCRSCMFAIYTKRVSCLDVLFIIKLRDVRLRPFYDVT